MNLCNIVITIADDKRCIEIRNLIELHKYEIDVTATSPNGNKGKSSMSACTPDRPHGGIITASPGSGEEHNPTCPTLFHHLSHISYYHLKQEYVANIQFCPCVCVSILNCQHCSQSGV